MRIVFSHGERPFLSLWLEPGKWWKHLLGSPCYPAQCRNYFPCLRNSSASRI